MNHKLLLLAGKTYLSSLAILDAQNTQSQGVWRSSGFPGSILTLQMWAWRPREPTRPV